MLKRIPYSLIILIAVLTSSLLQAQDWAQLNTYKNANEQLLKMENKGDRIVFMGNSITVGWLDHYPEFFENTSYINRGISGQTTPQMLIRFRQDVVDLNPAAVVILAGTNDIAGNTGPATTEMIMANIKGMSEIAASNGIKVILASVLPAFDYPWRPGCEPNTRIPALNSMIKKYAESEGFIYLDYFNAMKNDQNGMIESLAYDGVHPNKEGYKLMAPLTQAAISQVLLK